METSKITVDDMREWKRQLDEAGIEERLSNIEFKVIPISDTHYEITGAGRHMVVLKETWDKAIQEYLNK